MTSLILAVAGLTQELDLLVGPQVMGLASGGDVTSLTSRLEAALTPTIAGVISIGVAGGLDPSLAVGDAVVAIRVIGPTAGFGVDARWSQALSSALPEARQGLVAGSDQMLVDAEAKLALFQGTSALCVDMESHLAAAVCADRGLPFAALRFISDTARRALPKAAQAGMKPDGGVDIFGVLKALVLDPGQLPALIRTGKEAQIAFRALRRGRSRLSATLGFPDV